MGRAVSDGAIDAIQEIERISQACAQIEILLEQVEQSITHYQVLGIPRSADSDEILSSYQDVMRRLTPQFYNIQYSFPIPFSVRLKRALRKTREAYDVLGHCVKRIEYDKYISRRATVPIPVSIPDGPSAQHQIMRDGQGPAESAARIPPVPKEAKGKSKQVAHTTPGGKTGSEVRRIPRLRLSVPARVVGHDKKLGQWNEIAATTNLSKFGIGLVLRHRVRRGMVLHLSMPMPVKFRSHSHHEATYGTYAIVRRVDQPKKGERIVGLEFLGPSPPAGYIDRPWSNFRIQTWSGRDRRRETRLIRSEAAQIEFLNEAMEVVGTEQGITENICPGGAQVCLNNIPVDVDYVRIVCTRIGLRSTAYIRDMYRGKDGKPRISLEFVED
jgi:hypothetical protein